MRSQQELECDAESIQIIISREKCDFERKARSHFDLNTNSKARFDIGENSVEIDCLFMLKPGLQNIQGATNAAREARVEIQTANALLGRYKDELLLVDIQWHKILANTLACVIMFMIGAPLGSIIKRGGIGVPFLLSIFFFIVYTLLGMQGEKLVKQNLLSAVTGIWMANFLLFFTGLSLLRAARNDARLFETDFYKTRIRKLKPYFRLKPTH